MVGGASLVDGQTVEDAVGGAAGGAGGDQDGKWGEGHGGSFL